MGQEAEAEARRDAFAAYRVDDALIDAAGPDAVAMHCLPAHRGEEITSAVMDGPRSLIFDQSENRLHVQKALLVEVHRRRTGVSDALYERYKDALRRGHVAPSAGGSTKRSRRTARRRGSPRTGPALVGIGQVLARLGKPTEACVGLRPRPGAAPTTRPRCAAGPSCCVTLGDRVARRRRRSIDWPPRSMRPADGPTRSMRHRARSTSPSRAAGARRCATMVDRFASSPPRSRPRVVALDRAEALLAARSARSRADPPHRPEPSRRNHRSTPPRRCAAVEEAAAAGDAETARSGRPGRPLAVIAPPASSTRRSTPATMALATNPADPGLHLALAELYLDRGWRSAAADKLVLLARLVDLGRRRADPRAAVRPRRPRSRRPAARGDLRLTRRP